MSMQPILRILQIHQTLKNEGKFRPNKKSRDSCSPPLKTKETNVAEPTLQAKQPWINSPGNTMSSFPDRFGFGTWKSMEVSFCGPTFQMAEIHGLSMGGDPNNLALTNWENPPSTTPLKFFTAGKNVLMGVWMVGK